MLYLAGVLFVILCALIYFVFIKPFTYWTNNKVPQYKFWEIWLKNISDAIKQPPLTDAMMKLYKDFPDNRYVGTYQLFVPKLCIRDPELIKQIFVKEFDHFVDHTMFIPTDGDPIWEKSLFSLRGDEWKQMRAVASPSFTSSKMKFMFELMLKCVEQSMRFFEDKNSDFLTLEMKDTFGRITNDVFATTHFGVECDSLKERNNEMFLMGERGVDFGGFWIKVRYVLIQMFPSFTRVLGIRVFDQAVNRFFKGLVRENMKYREKHGVVRPDLIHLLMNEKHENSTNEVGNTNYIAEKGSAPTLKKERRKNVKLTEEDITALAMAFFGGGYDSTSTLLSFAAYELALQPEVQEKLQNEIDETMINCNGCVTYEILMQMKYLDMVVSETLRKWPGGFFLDRCCVKPYTIEPINPGEVPIHLKKGDSVWLSLYALHREPKFYPDPEKFVPERFSDENKSIIHPYAYMPFGIGPRHCIGNRFALMEAKLVLVHLLSRYNVSVVGKTVIPIRLERRNFQLTSKDGFWLGLERRIPGSNLHQTIKSKGL